MVNYYTIEKAVNNFMSMMSIVDERQFLSLFNRANTALHNTETPVYSPSEGNKVGEMLWRRYREYNYNINNWWDSFNHTDKTIICKMVELMFYQEGED